MKVYRKYFVHRYFITPKFFNFNTLEISENLTNRNRTEPCEGAALAGSGASGCWPAPHAITIAPLGLAPANKDHAGAVKENPFRISTFKADVPTF